MPACLLHNTLPGVDQNNDQVAIRRTRYHVAGILHVARRICNNEFSFWGRKIPVGYITSNALLTFGTKTVSQVGKGNFSGLCVLTLFFQLYELSDKDVLAFVKQAPDQRAFAVVHAPCSN